MKNVIILGTGGCASELTFYIEDHNSKVGNEDKVNILGYIDYDYNIKDYYDRYGFKAPVLCDIDTYVPKEEEEVLVAIMSLDFRMEMFNALLKKKAKIGSFIHHTVIRPKDLKLGIGNIVFPYCILEKHSVIGNYNMLTSYSFISHDCVVGDNNFLSIAGLAGWVKIGNNNYFGLRSMVIPRMEIGNNNVIQAGMIVDKHLKDDTTVFYRFKEKILAIPKIN